jgi:hypothetical protein
MTFKVDTLLAGFKWLHDQFLNTAARHELEAQVHNAIINKAVAARQAVLEEASRARNAAAKLADFLHL